MTAPAERARARLYVGVGIRDYDDSAFEALPRAPEDVRALGASLRALAYDTETLCEPTDRNAIRDWLDRALAPAALRAGDALIVLWCGHAEPAAEGLSLVARNTRRAAAPWLTSRNLAGVAARSGASQILVILDTCYSGSDVPEALKVANDVLDELAGDRRLTWTGVLTSTAPLELAREGALVAHLTKLLREGPADPELHARWSVHAQGLRGDDLVDALVKEWAAPDQNPRFVSSGNALPMLANPLFRPDAPDVIVEQLLQAARGVDPGEEAWYFTGRRTPLQEVVDWIEAAEPGVLVVTGPAGAGKSAIVGRVVSLANPRERRHILSRAPLDHADPGEGTVAAHVLARNLTPDRLVADLDRQLVAGGTLPPAVAQQRTRQELLASLEGLDAAPLIVVDALDEAGDDAWRIAEQVIRPLGACARVLVGTRELVQADGRALIGTLDADRNIDIGRADLTEETADDVRRYVERRLVGHAPANMDPRAVAREIASATSEGGEGAFLVARLATGELREQPVDTTQEGWERELVLGVGAALDRELDRIEPLRRNGAVLEGAAAELLAALAWSYGAGIPDDLWPIVATAISERGHAYTREDVFWVLRQAGRFIVQSGAAGEVVYRLAHQRLVERFVPARRFEAAEESAFAVVSALVDHYLQLLDAGLAPDEPRYLWFYTWLHGADGGTRGVDRLRKLAEVDPDAFRLDLAIALHRLSDLYYDAGDRDRAVAPAQESVELLRGRPEYKVRLADVLGTLALRYGGVGRYQEAYEAETEAIDLYREMAEDERMRLGLAMALSNLTGRLAKLDRSSEAVAPAEEAVEIVDELARRGRAVDHELALVLSNLCAAYSRNGRPEDAIAAGERAASLYDRLVLQDPSLSGKAAGVRSNVSIALFRQQRVEEAVLASERAVRDFEQVREPEVSTRLDHGYALAARGVMLSASGREDEAISATEDAVAVFESLPAENPAFAVELAKALDQLSWMSAERDRHDAAVASARRAAGIYARLPEALPGRVQLLGKLLRRIAVSLATLDRVDETAPAWAEIFDAAGPRTTAEVERELRASLGE